MLVNRLRTEWIPVNANEHTKTVLCVHGLTVGSMLFFVYFLQIRVLREHWICGWFFFNFRIPQQRNSRDFDMLASNLCRHGFVRVAHRAWCLSQDIQE